MMNTQTYSPKDATHGKLPLHHSHEPGVVLTMQTSALMDLG